QEKFATQLQGGMALVFHEEREAAAKNQNATSKKTPEKESLPDITLVYYPDQTLRRHVADSSLHLAVIYIEEKENASGNGLRTPGKWELVYRAGSPTSEAALHFVESRPLAYNGQAFNNHLTELLV